MRSIGFCFCVLLAVSANGQTENFKWLLGTWKLANKNTFEVWKRSAEKDVFIGSSFRVNAADTIVTEQIRFTHDEKGFHYISDVAGDQPPVDFKVTVVGSGLFVAENQLHDFPKVIRYKFVKKDQREYIEASIEGDGKVIPYNYERIK